jgi:hypothetical protein
MIGSKTRLVSVALSTFALVVLVASCGSTEEARKRAAQSGAEKYFEMVRAGKYADAFRRTFTKRYQSRMPIEAFEAYRGKLAESTGMLRSVTIVKAEPSQVDDRIRLTYALEGDKIPQPAYEILDMRKDGDDWKVDDLNMAPPGATVK